MNIQIVRHDVVGSTNDEAIHHAKMGANEGLCIVANQQTDGRGREGRNWSSEVGAGLYLSVILRPDLESKHLPILTLLCAIAVYETVNELTGVRPDIKWPNDILVDEKKISGILLETCETPQGTAVIAGIGLNLNSDRMPDGVRVISTSINELSEKERSINECLQVLSRHLTMRYQALLGDKNVTPILGDWSARSSYARGKEVCVTMRHGTVFGETVGLDQTGALLIRQEHTGRILAVTAGDVRSVRKDDRDEKEKSDAEKFHTKDVNSDQLCDDEGVVNIEQVQ